MKKSWKIVIISLCVLLFLQTCSSCSKKQELSFKEVETKNLVDSFENVISIKDSIIIRKDSIITKLETTLEQIEQSSEKTIKLLNENNKYIVNKLKEKNKE
jgi:hypothetical protein